jgi:uncharacterized protein
VHGSPQADGPAADVAAGARPRARTPWVDGLRALALVGVVIVNGVGYAQLPDTLFVVPPPVPAESAGAFGLQVALVALLQGKAYPLMAFLFGFGLASAWRARWRTGDDPAARARRRQWRLLALGAAHGALLYSGDVLTAYALVGLWLTRWMRLRPRAVLKRLGVVLAVAVVAAGLEAWALASMAGDPLAWGAAPQGYGWVRGPAEHVGLSASGYLVAVAGLPVVVPQVLALMAAGLLAARLGILTRARWRGLLARVAAWALPVGLAANLMIAWVVMGAGTSAGGVPHPALAGLLIVGPLLTFGVVARLALRPPRALAALAGVGRMSLSVYLGSSLAHAVLLGGAGLGLGAGATSVTVAAVSAGTCLVLMALAHRVAVRHGTGPLERWLARR